MEETYIVMGTAALAADIARFLLDAGQDVSVWEKSYSGHSSVRALCAGRGISYRSFSEDAEISSSLRALLEKGRLKLVSAVNTYIFPKDIVEHGHFTGINYHNALLPAHRGMNAEAWSIYAGDKVTGITWHRIASEVDKGELLCTRELPLSPEITSLKLLKAQAEAAYGAFTELADDLIHDRLTGSPQPQEKTAFHFIRDVPNGGMLDPDWPAERISAFLRAMDYGILFTLGHPCVMIEGRKYTAGRYRLIREPAPYDRDELCFDRGTLTIRKKGACTGIVLSGLKEAGADPA